jgi:hypothetical protein
MFNRNDGNYRRPETKVSFYSDDVIAMLELDANEVAVPVSRLCKILGLDPQVEIARLQDNPILVAGLSTLPVDTDWGVERQPCLRVDLVPLWMTTVSLDQVDLSMRPKLELFHRECASVLWQAFKPQGFNPEDALVPAPHEMEGAEQAYQSQMGMAVLSRQQMLIERQINNERSEYGQPREQVVDPMTRQMAQAVRVVANNLAMRSRRNEYGGVYQGLYRQFGITSYRDMPRGRYIEAMEWLDRWRGDIEGEPEPPPDI